MSIFQTFPLLMKALASLQSGEHERAIEAANNADEGGLGGEIAIFRPDFLRIQGEAQLALGRLDEARESLEEARAVADSHNSRRTLWQILAALMRLEKMAGNNEAAAALKHEAEEVVEFIAEHAGSTRLTTKFLGTPAVREIFDG